MLGQQRALNVIAGTANLGEGAALDAAAQAVLEIGGLAGIVALLAELEGSSGGGAWGDITGTLSAQTDLQTALNGKQPLDSDLTALAALSTTAYGRSLLELANVGALYSALSVDTDGTLTANSDTKLASQKAVKTYADALIAANDAMVFKGSTDCSANPNYPAADRGHTYRVSVAGKIGGASGTNVEAGDLFICLTDGTSAGNQATVGSAWVISQANIDGAVVGPASSVSSNFPTFSGTSGKLIQDSGLALDTDGTLAANSDLKIPSQKAVKTALDTKALIQETVNAVGATGSTETIPDVTSSTVHRLVLDANCTLTFPTAGAGKSFTLVLVQDASVGGHTVTWPATVKWPSAVAPTLSTAVNKVDLLTFLCADGTNWLSTLVALDYR